MVVLSGLAANAFMFFWARFGVGIAKASTIPVHGSVIADTYPIGIRGRIGALNGVLNNGLRVTSPILVGAIAVIDLSDGAARLHSLPAEPHRVRLSPKGTTVLVLSDRSKVAWVLK
jgi:MFS family permease